MRTECKCGGKGCARCETALILEKSGPSVVYSGDIKPRDPKIKPVHDRMIIVKLGEGQKIKMEMTARLGFMTEHAKYQGVLASCGQLRGDDEFRFVVESYNNLTIEEIIETAISALNKRLSELENAFFGEGKSHKAASKAKKATKKATKTKKKKSRKE